MSRMPARAHDPSFRDLFRSLLLPVLLPQWLRVAFNSMADSMLPLFALSLGAPAAAVGAIVGAQFFGVTISVLGVAAAVERAGLRAGIIAGLLICASCFAMAAATPTWRLLVESRFVNGIGNAAWMVARMTFITNTVPKRMRGRWNSLEGTIAKSVEIVGPAVGGAIATFSGGYRSLFWAAVLGNSLAAVLVLATFDRASAVAGPDGVAPSDRGTCPGRREFARACAVREMRWAVPFVMAARMSLQAITVLLTLRLVLTFEQSAVVVGAMGALRNVASVLGIAASGFIMDSRGRKAVGVPGLLLLVISILGTAAAPSAGYLWAIHGLLGAADGLVTPCIQTLQADLAPQQSRSLFIAVFRVVNSFGNGLGPILGGALAHASIDHGCLVAAALALFSAALYSFVGVETLTMPASPGKEVHDADHPASPLRLASLPGGGGLAILAARASNELPPWVVPASKDRLAGADPEREETTIELPSAPGDGEDAGRTVTVLSGEAGPVALVL